MKSFVARIIVLSGLGMLLVTGVTAQQKGMLRQGVTAEQRAERMTQDLKKELNLNEQQTNQVAEINCRTTQEMEQGRNNQTLSRQERRAQMHQIQERRTAQINALLSVQQRGKFAKHQQARQHQQPKRRMPRSGRRQ
ncbi:MAG: hypothetical protein LPK09_13915, partial [Hymenobacteraceae bacterium]|nr:hypothetical protein [Hymenobacteraceae bacterium]